MPTEKHKMLAGELYDALDPELTRDRERCRQLCKQLNDSREDQIAERREILAALLGMATDAWLQPPFHSDYGYNIHLGNKVYFNFNCIILDVMPVTIGNHTLIGPAVQIYTATHPLSAIERRTGLEFAKPITIGSDVWIGGAAIICPGVTIGDRSIIGAGSVVTRDIPADVIAAGNSCRVLRQVEATSKVVDPHESPGVAPMEDLLFACSGPGAGEAIAQNIHFAGQHALLAAGLAMISIGLWLSCRRYLVIPIAALTAILIHPAWTISALGGDCGMIKASMAWAFTIVLFIGLCWQTFCWLWIVRQSRLARLATVSDHSHD